MKIFIDWLLYYHFFHLHVYIVLFWFLETKLTDRNSIKSKHMIMEKVEFRLRKLFELLRTSYFVFWYISRAVAISIGILVACVLIPMPWTTVPRTNSILHQTWWMEVTLPSASYFLLHTGGIVLNLVVWTKERSIRSAKVCFKMFLAYIIPWLLSYVSCYLIWSVYYGFKHPMPNLGLTVLISNITFAAELWIVLPSDALGKQDFRRKLRLFMGYFAWVTVVIAQNEILAYFFWNFPKQLQFLVAFMIGACREFDFYLRSLLVGKMMGLLDESSTALITITTDVNYGVFVAKRLAGATLETVCSIVAIDFFIHLKNTHEVIKEHRRVNFEELEHAGTKMAMYTTKLVVSELTEGFIPLVYGACMWLAVVGPNYSILANVGSEYWGEKIVDIVPLLSSMAILFAFDVISLILTSFVLWKFTNINMLQEFCNAIDKYWFFFIIMLGRLMSGNFALSDINLGMDSTGKFDWINSEGRKNLMYN